jgi:hypothetical protein
MIAILSGGKCNLELFEKIKFQNSIVHCGNNFGYPDRGGVRQAPTAKPAGPAGRFQRAGSQYK